MSNINTLLETAIKKNKNSYNKGSFLLRNFFKNYGWGRISRSTQLMLLSLFINKSFEIVACTKRLPIQPKYLIAGRKHDA